MPKPLVDRIPFKKIVTGCAVGVAVGFGLCGLNAFLEAHGIGSTSTREGSFSSLLVFDLVLLGACFFGLILAFIAWALLALLKNLGVGVDKKK